MTTRVHVDAHAGWPVLVTLISLDDDGHGLDSRSEVVAPMAAKDFYIHSHQMITCVEQKAPPKDVV